MLIKALCDYYDILAEKGKVLPEGYSNVSIRYKIALTEKGELDEIIDWQEKQVFETKKKEIKEKAVPRTVIMPKRTEKPGIDANIIDHRPLYIFGLNYGDGTLTVEDKTGKAKKSHDSLVKSNLEFIEGLDSPVVNAYRQFLLNWKPEAETNNEHLLNMGKNYASSGFVFCLSGSPDNLLHEDSLIKGKWEQAQAESKNSGDEGHIAVCAITGEKAPIARVHSKIKKVSGGLATGSVLIGFNNSSENSYGNEQSYNSNISEGVMEKYTEALNYVLADSKHKIVFDDVTVVFWAMDSDESYEDRFMAMLSGQTDNMNAEQVEGMLEDLLKRGKQGYLTGDDLGEIDDNIDFYIVGLKPNTSRISIKFIFRKKYADVLWNIARFQQDMQVSSKLRPVSFARIKKELVSPKSTNEKVNPALFSKLFEAVIYGNRLPKALLETVVRRVKTDSGESKVNGVRTGLIKACINRDSNEEELKMALDKENYSQAYLCGRLFAVLEKVQQRASKDSLNRTIKDSYFASAASKPSMVFPKLMKLSQNHLNKLSDGARIFYTKLIGEIISNIEGEFPDTMSLKEQGRFIVGYYQQYQSFFEKQNNEEK